MVEAGDQIGRQRSVVYDALRELLHVAMIEKVEFAKISVVFQHAKRSWPTVLSWVLRASIVPQGQQNAIAYLLGMRLARQQRSSSHKSRPFTFPVTLIPSTSASNEPSADDAPTFQPPERSLAEQVRWEFVRRGNLGILDRCSGPSVTVVSDALSVRFAEKGVSLEEGAVLVYRACCEVSRYVTSRMTMRQTWAAISERIDSAILLPSKDELA